MAPHATTTIQDEVLSPVPAKEHKRTHRVRFASKDKNTVFPITHIDDMSEEDIVNTWYEKKDYDHMKRMVILVVRKLMKGEKVEESNKQTVRGLEYRVRSGAMKRQQNKLDATDILMEEQSIQRESGDYDAEEIARLYHEVCKHCLEEARELGIQDELAIQKDSEKIRRKYSAKSLRRSKMFPGFMKQSKFRAIPMAAVGVPNECAKPVMGQAA